MILPLGQLKSHRRCRIVVLGLSDLSSLLMTARGVVAANDHLRDRHVLLAARPLEVEHGNLRVKFRVRSVGGSRRGRYVRAQILVHDVRNPLQRVRPDRRTRGTPVMLDARLVTLHQAYARTLLLYIHVLLLLLMVLMVVMMMVMMMIPLLRRVNRRHYPRFRTGLAGAAVPAVEVDYIVLLRG